MVVPHTPIPISSIRTNDIILLLTLGCITETLRRFLLFRVKVPSSASKAQRQSLTQLRMETIKMRNIGPSKFVETSKLERKILTLEKDLKDGEESRKQNVKSTEQLLKRLGIVVNFVIFLMYYGIPLLTIDGLRIPLVNPELVSGLEDSSGGSGGLGEGEGEGVDVLHATMFMKGIMFPLSYVGIGMKISKLGLGEIKHCSTGALVVFWSAQVMAGKIFDCFEALTFR
mmetsp:Transcript_24569/g.36685  ORF Transcript_24569/g.36685 Transcript_24569/m.36685 type:complete len:228 (-) Transcript_24569:122-805(-)